MARKAGDPLLGLPTPVLVGTGPVPSSLGRRATGVLSTPTPAAPRAYGLRKGPAAPQRRVVSICARLREEDGKKRNPFGRRGRGAPEVTLPP
jgi:hypothetical protein